MIFTPIHVQEKVGLFFFSFQSVKIQMSIKLIPFACQWSVAGLSHFERDEERKRQTQDQLAYVLFPSILEVRGHVHMIII